MSKIHTYYDNLKVSRNAPSEVIRAAYKSLAVKYHPDRNLSNKDDATRVMALINEAYEVLSDVEKRKQHDIWIKEQENPKIKNDVIQPNLGTDNNSEIIKNTNYEIYSLAKDIYYLKEKLTALGFSKNKYINNLLLIISYPLSLSLVFLLTYNFWTFVDYVFNFGGGGAFEAIMIFACMLTVIPSYFLSLYLCRIFYMYVLDDKKNIIEFKNIKIKVLELEKRLQNLHTKKNKIELELLNAKEVTLKSKIISIISHLLEYGAIYLVLMLFAFVFVQQSDFFNGSSGKPYVKPVLAPNGESWPSQSGYLYGYRQLNNIGLSSLTIDNSANSTDVFVKLFSVENNNIYQARAFYIAAHDSFIVENITAGKYDIRYLDLGDGSIYRSDLFNLSETETYNGVKFSNLTITLYKVQNGNMQTRKISGSEF